MPANGPPQPQARQVDSSVPAAIAARPPPTEVARAPDILIVDRLGRLTADALTKTVQAGRSRRAIGAHKQPDEVDEDDPTKGFFDQELPAKGWTIDSELEFGDGTDSYSAYSISGNGYTGGVYVGEGAPGSEGFEGDFAFWVALTAE